MNRRSFLSTMLAAACTAVARAYVPAALTAAPRYVDRFVWNWTPEDEAERRKLLIRYENLRYARGDWQQHWETLRAEFDASRQ